MQGGRRALGRGLGALIPGADVTPETGIVEIPVEQISPNALQPRTGFDAEPLAELEASIREHGVLQPVLVRPASGKPGRFEIVAGERRWRAASAAGLKTVPAIVRHMDDRGALEAALVENLQREDLNPIERARAYRRLIHDFGLTQESVAGRVGRSQSTVANTLRLLALPAEVQTSVEAGRLTEGHARALLAVADPGKLRDVWRQVEARGLSVRETEALARKASISREMRRPRPKGQARDINNIQLVLSESLGAPVRLRLGGDGSGHIEIAFFSAEDLERLVELLRAARAR
ncbi:MAG: ParB/RepB/Spo0J family partition protein [Armatimonadota bacterium]|nr:ParB/RepB/Spo0J family partition protein [Armatimonadota bacterium]